MYGFPKNLPLPVTNVQQENYKRQLYVHKFGINNTGSKKATMILYAEHIAGKSVDDVISNLDCYIEENMATHHTNLTIYAGNCFLQNKNRYLWT